MYCFVSAILFLSSLQKKKQQKKKMKFRRFSKNKKNLTSFPENSPTRNLLKTIFLKLRKNICRRKQQKNLLLR